MRSIYSRRPTSMPTWASADRTVQRGCEPSAINPLQGEKRERGLFLVPAILAQNEIFSISPSPGRPWSSLEFVRQIPSWFPDRVGDGRIGSLFEPRHCLFTAQNFPVR